MSKYVIFVIFLIIFQSFFAYNYQEQTSVRSLIVRENIVLEENHGGVVAEQDDFGMHPRETVPFTRMIKQVTCIGIVLSLAVLSPVPSFWKREEPVCPALFIDLKGYNT